MPLGLRQVFTAHENPWLTLTHMSDDLEQALALTTCQHKHPATYSHASQVISKSAAAFTH